MKKLIQISAFCFLFSTLCLAQTTQTPVLIPIQSMFGGAAINKPLTITPANHLAFDGQNLWAGSYLIVPASATNPIVSLYPGNYLLSVQSVATPARFTVPSQTNVWTLVPTSGPLWYWNGTNFANINAAGAITLLTNADGSLTLTAPLGVTNGTASAVIGGVIFSNNLLGLGLTGIGFGSATNSVFFESGNELDFYGAGLVLLGTTTLEVDGIASFTGNGSLGSGLTTWDTNGNFIVGGVLSGNGSGLTHLPIANTATTNDLLLYGLWPMAAQFTNIASGTTLLGGPTAATYDGTNFWVITGEDPNYQQARLFAGPSLTALTNMGIILSASTNSTYWDRGVLCPWRLYQENGTNYLPYFANNDSTNKNEGATPRLVGLAYAPVGSTNFVKFQSAGMPTVVWTNQTAGLTGIYRGFLTKKNGIYYMMANGSDAIGEEIYEAASTNITGPYIELANNPVINALPITGWKNGHVCDPSLYQIGGVNIVMFGSFGGGQGGYAWSLDMTNWYESQANPFYFGTNLLSGGAIGNGRPSLVHSNGVYFMLSDVAGSPGAPYALISSPSQVPFAQGLATGGNNLLAQDNASAFHTQPHHFVAGNTATTVVGVYLPGEVSIGSDYNNGATMTAGVIKSFNLLAPTYSGGSPNGFILSYSSNPYSGYTTLVLGGDGGNDNAGIGIFTLALAAQNDYNHSINQWQFVPNAMNALVPQSINNVSLFDGTNFVALPGGTFTGSATGLTNLNARALLVSNSVAIYPHVSGTNVFWSTVP